MLTLTPLRPRDEARRIEAEILSLCRDRQIAWLVAARRAGRTGPLDVPDCGCLDPVR